MVRINANSHDSLISAARARRERTPDSPRALLAIAHPGHELLVHGWLEQAQPLVAVLTDGSGRNRTSRLDSTTRVLNGVGATPAAVYGAYADRRVYEAVRLGDEQFFLAISRALEEQLVSTNVELIVGDAAEREILAHDVWRAVVDAAVARAGRRLEHAIANYEFPIQRHANASHDHAESAAVATRQIADSVITCELSHQAMTRKLAVARGYEPLREQVETLIEHRGVEWFRSERLSPARPAWSEPFDDEPPQYEDHGRQLTHARHYPEAIEFHRHVRPLLACLHDWSEST